MNTYAYVSGNPLNAIDPLGLRTVTWRPAVARYRPTTIHEIIANHTVPSIVRTIRENYNPTFLYQTIGPPNSGYRNEDLTEVARLLEAYRMIEAIQQYEPTFAPPQPRAGLFGEGDFYNLEMRLEVVARLDRLRQIGYLGFEYSNRSTYSEIDIAQLDRVIDNYNNGMCTVVLPRHQFMDIELLEEMLTTSNVFISPEGIPFPSEDNYQLARQEYGDYRANGGTLSFQDWMSADSAETRDWSSYILNNATTTGRNGWIDSSTIRFTQDSISPSFRDGSTVDDLISGLRDGTIDPSTIPHIRIFEVEGQLFTLDNRRLYAFQQAGIPISTRPATSSEIQNESFKFTTNNGGTSIRVRRRR